jgi:hypothetical protein
LADVDVGGPADVSLPSGGHIQTETHAATATQTKK